MEDITTIDLKKYIKKKLFFPKTERQEIWLHNLPNNETLFDIINKIRKTHKEEFLIFTQEIRIINKTITKQIWLRKCTFLEKFTFMNNNHKNFLYFSQISFYNKAIIHSNIFEKKVEFYDIMCKEEFEFSNTTCQELSLFGNFQKEANFVCCKIHGEAKFLYKLRNNEYETTFKNNVSFTSSIFYKKVDLSKTIVEKEINFQDCIFKEKVRFRYTKFYNIVNFKNTTFEKLVDFYSVHFYKAQQFYLTDFLDRAIFSNTTFKGETQFLYNKVESNSYINFESAKFEKGLDISRANFNCNLNFWNIFIQDDKIFEFTNYTDDFGEHKEEAVPSVYKQLRETYRIIKSNFYSQNNKIEGLKFYEKEMSVYLEEKREETNKKSPPKNKKTFIEKFREKFMEEPILSVGQLLILFFTILWTILKCPIFYIASAIFTSLIISGIIIKNKESLKYRNPIKQNYYMPIILLVIAIILLYFYIYNIHNIKNPFYIIVTYIMLFFSMLLFYFPLEKDKIILWLNKNSNEFDTNWVVGVNFSMLVGCLTYFTILLSINSNIVFDESPKGISNFLTSLVDVFNITKWDNLEIIGVKLKDLSYLLLFIGRIFIGYGYYQTIQAFRKFGKS
ncbi:pentapeptide repeat-containing protein [Capnocytophaga leadbetteri]|jgi:putative membrane protein|uniref:pentapeptide repeat-containing protein n=1 Tax=Capnocytophaga leadbetteri TaxID=327575 RepID=UPI0028ED0794|nr:pentapeptide repeat-containing protein [Capnocytophaga leadbetteri]